jgi:hypothetical protein
LWGEVLRITEDIVILPKYFGANRKKKLVQWGSIDGKYNTGEALRMINTRRQGIKDECNKKTRWILSHQEKKTVAVRSATYYG